MEIRTSKEYLFWPCLYFMHLLLYKGIIFKVDKNKQQKPFWFLFLNKIFCLQKLWLWDYYGTEPAGSVQMCPWSRGTKIWDYLFLMIYFIFCMWLRSFLAYLTMWVFILLFCENVSFCSDCFLFLYYRQ